MSGYSLYTFNGDSDDAKFGWSVSGAGDVNGDGLDDLIVGAFRVNDDAGSARLFSGATGLTLFTMGGDSADDLLGWSVSGAGDVNADGLADVIVGAPRDDNTGSNSGSARVVSMNPRLLLDDVALYVVALNLQQGINNNLDAKLGTALQAIEDLNQNNDVAAINALLAFINAVEAQRGNHIPEADADVLVASAQAVVDMLTLP